MHWVPILGVESLSATCHPEEVVAAAGEGSAVAFQTPLTPLAPLTPLLFIYQPDNQLVFLLVERLIDVNLYSSPTEIAKFTSYCAYLREEFGASLNV